MKAPGYQIHAEIYNGEETLVCRGSREADGQDVILKILKEDHAGPEETRRFRHEYEILKGLDAKGVVKPY